MRRLKKSVFFFVSILLISVIIQSCCDNQNVEIIGAGEMIIEQSDNLRRDTIRDDFRLVINLDVKITNNFNDFGIIQTSYATSCPEIYVNPIKEETLQLFCNKEIKYDGVTIPANTDFINLEKMQVFSFEIGGTIEINLLKELLELEEGEYEFSTEFQTSKEERFTNEASTYLDL